MKNVNVLYRNVLCGKKYKINASAWKTLGKLHENTEHNGVVARARTACQIPTFVK